MKKIIAVLIVLIMVPSMALGQGGPMTYIGLLESILNNNSSGGSLMLNSPDYSYFRALELGLANLYIPYGMEVDQDIYSATLTRARSLGLKVDHLAKELNPKLDPPIPVDKAPTPVEPSVETLAVKESGTENYKDVSIGYNFTSDFFGTFEGKLFGRDDFTGFRVRLLTRSNLVIKEVYSDKDGYFLIDGFDISLVTKLQGYKGEVYGPNGQLITFKDLP